MQKLKSSCEERFAPVVKALEKLVADENKKSIVVALDGRCASGKSTLGLYLSELFDANLFHMDDFFLQSDQRTEERLKEIGGNVDYERFRDEVLNPVLDGREVRYRRFDCKSMTIGDACYISPKRVSIIEGSYCRNPYFGDNYDLKVFTNIDERDQIDNIRNRNGEEKLQVFLERWIPKEEAYFKKYQIRETSDIIVEWRRTDDIHSDI